MPPFSSICFYLFASLMVLLAIIAVTARNIFHSAIALTGSLSVVACLFALLGADFLAATQLLLYVGGIMIIMLFVIMFSQHPFGMPKPQTNEQWLWGAALALTMAGVLIVTFKNAFAGVSPGVSMTPTTASIGRLLLSEFLIPFEAVSLVLLAALIGAVLFTHQETGGGERQ